jgi:hypothetical protein
VAYQPLDRWRQSRGAQVVIPRRYTRRA